MGEIMLARAEGADGFTRKVVLKGLLPSLDDDAASLEMFRREARIMSRLEHPNVVRVLDFTYVADKPYLAMEYVRGRNLHQVIQRAVQKDPSGLPARIALHVMAEALRGLHSAHTARDEDGKPLGAVHRDVSPGNVLLGFFGEVKVTDFGIAKPAGAKSLTGPRAIRGKARYAPPEVIRGEPSTPKSDVFAAGVVLAETLTGEPLWEHTGVSETLIRIVTEPRETTIERILDKSPPIVGLRAVLRRSLALKPDDRFASAFAFAEALDQLSRGVGGPINQAELASYMRELFAGAPDMPRDESLDQQPIFLEPASRTRDDEPDATPQIPAQNLVDDDPYLRTPHPFDQIPIPVTGTLRPPHWSQREPMPATPRLLPVHLYPPVEAQGSVDPAHFSELIALPSETSQDVSGGLDTVPAEGPMERLSRWQWGLLLQRRWVLVCVGILLGAGTAILGTLLATLHR